MIVNYITSGIWRFIYGFYNAF